MKSMIYEVNRKNNFIWISIIMFMVQLWKESCLNYFETDVCIADLK